MQNWRLLTFAALLTVLCVGLPLAGIVAAGRPVAPYMEFPPLTRYVPHAPFSWPVFLALAVLSIGVVVPFLLRVIAGRPATPSSDARAAMPPALAGPRRLPWWAWVGLALTASAWILAWTRFAWFSDCQPFTFTPLWLGYILTINAIAWKRSGRCMLLNRPRLFLALFPVSAVFWWYFEYLNRFVQNWHYVGIADLSPLQYFAFATLPFSTVLPAVWGTGELLRTFPRLTSGLERFMPLSPTSSPAMPWIVLMAAGFGLAGIGIWPDVLFPLLWLSPLIIISCVQAILGQPTVFSPIRRGDWTSVCLFALSALICGFFWEMWNCGSMARWIYTVPFVNRFHVFEMPIVGYAGYLPFGLECAAIGGIVAGRTERRPAEAEE